MLAKSPKKTPLPFEATLASLLVFLGVDTHTIVLSPLMRSHQHALQSAKMPIRYWHYHDYPITKGIWLLTAQEAKTSNIPPKGMKMLIFFTTKNRFKQSWLKFRLGIKYRHFEIEALQCHPNITHPTMVFSQGGIKTHHQKSIKRGLIDKFKSWLSQYFTPYNLWILHEK